ncbi:helix-turn-helix domain-containing protein [Caballeronia sp. SEWSISQ10-4 2]|uniref:helix-turn-helix domain-containing protein n=1 Tax=Caballeronia sp. SEWSISQ10-4 2 TaxID=2937438 RepID=UPI0026554B0E|nr:helix-turn-helix transcriptional regulator [Caballeronia sp. SEWSISQ10-4 2]MDN7179059.1 helix-turn-helix domain-containing protein [Caballeronia sp. SEWSISQ10-4 2]
MASVDKQYFLDLMAARKLSMRGLATKMGMNHSQLSLSLSGKRRMQLDEAAALSEMFGVPLHDIVVAAGIESKPSTGKRVSVLGYVGNGGVVTMHAKDTRERTEVPCALPDHAAAIQFRTADTPLSWMDAWVAFYIPRENVAPECIGRFSLCQLDGGRVVVATVKRGYQDGTYALSGPYTASSVELDWATPLLFCRF